MDSGDGVCLPILRVLPPLYCASVVTRHRKRFSVVLLEPMGRRQEELRRAKALPGYAR